MESKSIIDYEKLEEERKARREKEAENWKAFNERLDREHNPLGKALMKAYENQKDAEDNKLKAKMEAEIEAAKKEAEERIRENYNQQYHREWTENDTDRAYREFVRSLTKK